MAQQKAKSKSEVTQCLITVQLTVKLYSFPEQVSSGLWGVTCNLGSHLPPDTSEHTPP